MCRLKSIQPLGIQYSWTYIVSSGALNSIHSPLTQTHYKPILKAYRYWKIRWQTNLQSVNLRTGSILSIF